MPHQGLLVVKDGLALVLWLSRLLGSAWHLPFTPAMRSGGLVLAALALGIYGTWQSLRVPAVRTIEIALAGLPVSLDGFSIVQLSDLHIGPFLKGDWLKGVVRKTNGLAPDLVAVTGDMIDGCGCRQTTPVLSCARRRRGRTSFLRTICCSCKQRENHPRHPPPLVYVVAESLTAKPADVPSSIPS